MNFPKILVPVAVIAVMALPYRFYSWAGVALAVSVLVMGLTFKENIPDTRNSKVHDIIRKLKEQGCDVFGHDPQLTKAQVEALDEPYALLEDGPFDVIIAAVSHKAYLQLTEKDILKALKKNAVFYDLRSIWKPEPFMAAGSAYLSL